LRVVSASREAIVPVRYYETPSLFDAYYFEQAVAYDATRTIPEWDFLSEQPFSLPRAISRFVAAGVLAIGVLAFADLLTGEPNHSPNTSTSPAAGID
jgi:hypothetical protein